MLDLDTSVKSCLCAFVFCCAMLYGLCVLCFFCSVCACALFNVLVWHLRDLLCEVALCVVCALCVWLCVLLCVWL